MFNELNNELKKNLLNLVVCIPTDITKSSKSVITFFSSLKCVLLFNKHMPDAAPQRVVGVCRVGDYIFLAKILSDLLSVCLCV